MLFDIVGSHEGTQGRLKMRLEFPSIEGVYTYAEQNGIRLESVIQVASMGGSAAGNPHQKAPYSAPPRPGSFAAPIPGTGTSPFKMALIAGGGLLVLVLALVMFNSISKDQGLKRSLQAQRTQLMSELQQLADQESAAQSTLASLTSERDRIQSGYNEYIASHADAYFASKANERNVQKATQSTSFEEMQSKFTIGDKIEWAAALAYGLTHVDEVQQVETYVDEYEKRKADLDAKIDSLSSDLQQIRSAAADRQTQIQTIDRQI